MAEKNRTFIVNDFFPNVENFPTQPELANSLQQLEIAKAKERMNTTVNQFSTGKMVNPVESIA
jgi:hypothetical protein